MFYFLSVILSTRYTNTTLIWKREVFSYTANINSRLHLQIKRVDKILSSYWDAFNLICAQDARLYILLLSPLKIIMCSV